MRKYQYNKKSGAVQDALHVPADEAPIVQQAQLSSPAPLPPPSAPPMKRRRSAAPLTTPDLFAEGGAGALVLDVPSPPPIGYSMFFYTVREGRSVLLTDRHGKSQIIAGPKQVWRWGKSIQAMSHHVAHPGEFLIVRFRDGRQEHLTGPAQLWADNRIHQSVSKEDAVQIAAKEAVVVYAEQDDGVARRVVHGPATFVPSPGEWLHTFTWHGNAPGGQTFQKVPGALVFQKLWMMPDQMYHDVQDVRTADDAVLTVRLMLFFELRDIERMLETSHDPIGDFLNAATSDVVDFVGRRSFDDFKSGTGQLNDLDTYTQLAQRATQCGYVLTKVVYRGYGAPPALQRLHDEATESRVRLQLERATQQQQQELEDFKLDRTLARAEKGRIREEAEQRHKLHLAQIWEDEDRRRKVAEREHLAELAKLGVDLTALLTAQKADRVIEVRGGEPHVHVDSLTP